MHIELTELLRCPVPHADSFLVLSTAEMRGRMVRSGLLGCPVCHREYPIVRGVAQFAESPGAPSAPPAPAGPPPPAPPEAATLQALLDLSGPGGFVVLVGRAARYAPGLAALMGGIHFVGVNPPADAEEQPMLSLVRGAPPIPLRAAVARAVVLGADVSAEPWVAEARRVLLRGRRLVIEGEPARPPEGVTPLAAGDGLWVGEKR